MAHPLHNKHTLNKQPPSEAYTNDENDAYLAYQYRFQSHTTSLLQTALDTEIIREAQFLEGSLWPETPWSMPANEPLPSDTAALGALVGLFRKNNSDFPAPRRDYLQPSSSYAPAQISAPFPDPQPYTSTPYDDIHNAQRDTEHEAYLFYTNLSQSHHTSRLIQAALNTEVIRDAQFLEGGTWSGPLSTESAEPLPQADTTVLGSLVNLFGSFRRR
jgi:hypothetical protein